MENKVIERMIQRLEKSKIDPLMISIEVGFNKNLLGWIGQLEPEDLCTIYNIKVNYTTDIETDTKIIIGNAICYQIDTINRLTGEEHYILDIADSISGDVLSAVSPFLDNEGMIKSEYYGQSILYIDSINIIKDFRNNGIGSFVLKFIAEELLNFSSIVTIIPNPIEYKDRDSFEHKKALKRLITFYESIGFSKISNEVWQYKFE